MSTAAESPQHGKPALARGRVSASAAARAIGRSPETFSLQEQFALAGLTVAYEIYTPERTPQRTIAAIGPTAADCIRDLEAAGLDPRNYEFEVLRKPW